MKNAEFLLGCFMDVSPQKVLEMFPNSNPERNYHIRINSPEFSCLCPKTGQPDFAEIRLDYVPDELCVELKSLKLYYCSFRNEGHFHEKVTNIIADDFLLLIKPRYLRVEAKFNVRGGIYTTVVVEYPEA
jgi:7-cyano-7-deazaguanine reductase